jgi:ribosomal protein L11 methylase PrmA
LELAGENGRLILSGIIEEQVGAVDRAVQTAGGQVIERMQIGDWVALVVTRL